MHTFTICESQTFPKATMSTTVVCVPFPPPPPIVEAFTIAGSSGKCIGSLVCKVAFADGSNTTLEVLGISGNGGATSTATCAALENYFANNAAYGVTLFVAPPSASRTIYAPVRGDVVSMWEAGFLDTFRRRMKNEVERISKDMTEKESSGDYTLQHYKDAMVENVVNERTQNELDWNALFTHAKILVGEFRSNEATRNTDPNINAASLRMPTIEAMVTHLTNDPFRNLIMVCDDDEAHATELLNGILAQDPADWLRWAGQTARALVSGENAENPSMEEKHNANGLARALLACADPTEDATKNTAIADAFVQCAEDNCTSCMLEQLDALAVSGQKIVRIDATWVSTIRNKRTKMQEQFDLCEFCKTRFENRLRYLLERYISTET